MKKDDLPSVSEQKTEKMALKDYYTSLPDATYPKTEFANKVALRCGVAISTVYNWINGRTKPVNPEHFDALSELTGIPQENLWRD